MLKLDFMNKSYNLEEIIDAYTDGSIDNFKGDEDFLTFLISYSLGIHLEGPDASKYQEYAKYDGLLNIMRFDEYGYFGKKIYKIYEICGKNKNNFMQVCDLIGKYSIKHSLEKETIDKNLQLQKPVDFLDNNIVLSNGKKPRYDPNKDFYNRYNLDFEERLEYDHELERSLRRRINNSIRGNKDETSLLEEMPSYIEKEQLKKMEAENKKVNDDHLVDINNLFFGSQNLDISGGVLGLNAKSISWFEYTNTDLLGYHIFRSIPTGDYCLLDDNGKIHIPDEIFKNDNISIGPNSPIRSVDIANIPTIFNSAISKLEEQPLENEEVILCAKGFLETLENKGQISVGEMKNYQIIIRGLYEEAFGTIFQQNQDTDYNTNENGNPSHK